jgi:hypothetical protein
VMTEASSLPFESCNKCKDLKESSIMMQLIVEKTTAGEQAILDSYHRNDHKL